MRREKTWGGELELVAMSKIFGYHSLAIILFSLGVGLNLLSTLRLMSQIPLEMIQMRKQLD